MYLFKNFIYLVFIYIVFIVLVLHAVKCSKRLGFSSEESRQNSHPRGVYVLELEKVGWGWQ